MLFCRREERDLVIKSNVTSIFFNRKWHKLEIQFGRDEIRMYIDCHFVGSFPVDVPMDLLLNDTGHVITASYDREHRSPTVCFSESAVKHLP